MPAAARKKSGAGRALILEQFTPYRVVALGHAISSKLSSAYADENLTIPEWRVLAVVAQAQRVAARDVVARTPMDKMTVSRAVASLEGKGYVVREPDETDRRVAALMLSPAGRDLFDTVAEKALALEEELLSALNADERARFLATLDKLETGAAAP